MVKKSDWNIDEDNKLIELYKRGYYAREIARKMNRTKGAIDKRIQKFKKEGKIEDLKAIDKEKRRIANREVRRAINRENSNFLGNRATIKASMSAYKNNSKGDLVLDKKKAKEQRFAYSWDMPGASINEEIREFNKANKSNKELNIIEYVKIEMERLKKFERDVKKEIERISC